MHPILRKYQHSMFFAARLIGLLPVTVDLSRYPPRARRSWLLLVYSLLLVCSWSAVCVVKTIAALHRRDAAKWDAFRELLLSFVTTFQILVPLLKADEYTAAFNQYMELIKNSEDTWGSGLPHSYTRTVKVLCCSTVFLYIVPTMLMVVLMYVESRHDWVPIAMYFSSKFSTHVQDTFLMIMIANIRARVQWLNSVLKELVDKTDAHFWLSGSWRARMLTSIQETRTQHFSNALLSRSIETAYGPQLLVSLAIFFVDAFFTFYYLLLSAAYNVHPGLSDNFRAVVLTYWTIVTFIEILTVVSVCDSAVTESAATSHLVRQLSWKIDDPELLFELEAFWLQTRHQPVRYRAGQYFHMNNKLIYKMARLMASYLLWATQMRVQKAAPSSAH